MASGRTLGDFEAEGLAVDDLVSRTLKFDQELVSPRRKPVNAQRFATGIEPVPRQIVKRDVQVSDAGNDAESRLAVDWHNSHVLRAVSDDDIAGRQLGWKR